MMRRSAAGKLINSLLAKFETCLLKREREEVEKESDEREVG